MASVNFYLLGAMKAGTSSLHLYLGQHPEVYMPEVKEPNTLTLLADGMPDIRLESFRVPLQRTEYEASNELGAGFKIRGDSSHSYLTSLHAFQEIERTFDGTQRAAVILRNPVERAFSHYLFLRRDGIEKELEPLKAFKRNAAGGYIDHQYGDYLGRSRYAEGLTRYINLFGPERIKIYLYEELEFEAPRLVSELFQFLEVDASFTADVSIRHQVSGIPKNQALHALLVKPNLLKKIIQPLLPKPLYRLATKLRDRNLNRERIPDDARAFLVNELSADMKQVETLIGRDLKHWFL